MNALTDKLTRSWQLFKRSVLVIQSHPKLLIFPIVTGLLTAAIALFFLAPVALMFVAPHWLAGTKLQGLANSFGFIRVHHGANFNFAVQPLGTALLAGFYLLNMFLASMSSVAFNHEILEALRGQRVSVMRGIQAACSRWKAVLFWSLLAGLVGLLIRALEQRVALVGRIVAGLIGLAWSVASIFAIPILARETTFSNPFAILSKSAQTIKRTWGEMLTGYVGMQGTNLLALWASILFWVATGFAAYSLSNPWLLLVGGVPWLLAILVYGYLANIASRVYLCALYLYAAEGAVPGQFEADMMNQGWKVKGPK
jgi:Family of unknown function (DUF6159)